VAARQAKSFPPPVPSILPMLPKVAQNKKLTLNSTLVAADAAAVALRWAMVPLTADSPEIDLEVVKVTPLTGPVLVVRNGALPAGSSYRFTLTASDANSPPGGVTAYIDLEVRHPCLVSPPCAERRCAEAPVAIEYLRGQAPKRA
jgi:hypothetical protein